MTQLRRWVKTENLAKLVLMNTFHLLNPDPTWWNGSDLNKYLKEAYLCTLLEIRDLVTRPDQSQEQVLVVLQVPQQLQCRGTSAVFRQIEEVI